jgi:hypothetical protein
VATDGNGFCSIQDGPLVLGVNFKVSSPTLITGVRVYRVDTGVVEGTLWKDGIVLASGQFAGSGTHEWSDLVFNSPVPVTPGTYMASYSVNSNYAYQHAFPWSSLTPAPPVITETLEGLYCYAAPDCKPNRASRIPTTGCRLCVVNRATVIPELEVWTPHQFELHWSNSTSPAHSSGRPSEGGE